MKRYALLTAQGTACAETVLDEEEYTPEWRATVEAACCNGGAADPVAGTWTDVTENEACDPEAEYDAFIRRNER